MPGPFMASAVINSLSLEILFYCLIIHGHIRFFSSSRGKKLGSSMECVRSRRYSTSSPCLCCFMSGRAVAAALRVCSLYDADFLLPVIRSSSFCFLERSNGVKKKCIKIDEKKLYPIRARKFFFLSLYRSRFSSSLFRVHNNSCAAD